MRHLEAEGPLVSDLDVFHSRSGTSMERLWNKPRSRNSAGFTGGHLRNSAVRTLPRPLPDGRQKKEAFNAISPAPHPNTTAVQLRKQVIPGSWDFPGTNSSRTHLDLVQSVACSVRASPPGKGIDFEDLVADGAEGLVEAAARFDPGRGVPFKAFAKHRIFEAQAMLDGILAPQHWLDRRVYRRLRLGQAPLGRAPANDIPGNNPTSSL